MKASDGVIASTLRRFLYGKLPAPEGWIFVIYNILFSTYLTLVLYTAYSPAFKFLSITIVVFLVSLVLIKIFFYLCTLICSKIDFIKVKVNNSREKNNLGIFMTGFLMTLFFLGLTLYLNYPGTIISDVTDQMEQARVYKINDWHPALHTLILGGLLRIFDNYAFVILSQITVFSMVIGYLLAVLSSWGIQKKFIFLTLAFIVLNPSTLNLLVCATKDSAFLIAVTLLGVQMANVCFSDGAWIYKYKNMLAFAITAALASVLRHNGIFFTYAALVFLLVMFFCRNKRILIPVLATFLFIWLIKHPLYSAFGVSKPHNTLTESIGIPMTIIGDVYTKNPEKLSNKTISFLQKTASPETWSEFYKTGSYNSIKWRLDASVIRESSFREIASMTFDAMYADPRNAFLAVRTVTACTWDLTGAAKVIRFDNYNAPQRHGRIGYSLDYDALMRGFWPFEWLFFKTGWQVMILMVAGLICCYRRGIVAFFIIVPICVYVFGTGMLLGGPDLRFFQLTAVLAAPFSLVLLSGRERDSIPGISGITGNDEGHAKKHIADCTVVIPCHNQGRFLRECLASVMAQNVLPKEIIVIDDGSTCPETKKILSSPRVTSMTRVLRNENSLGLSSARNKGISHATSTYILPLDADDRIGPMYIEQAVRILNDNPVIGLVGGESLFFGVREGKTTFPEFSEWRMTLDNCIISAVLFRKSDWVRVGGYCEDFKHGFEDWDFYLSLLDLRLGYHHLSETVFYYRRHGHNMTSFLDKNPELKAEIYKLIIKRHGAFFEKHAQLAMHYMYLDLAKQRAFGKIPIVAACRQLLRAFGVVTFSR